MTALIHSAHIANRHKHSSDLLVLDEHSHLSAKLTIKMYLKVPYLGLSWRIEAFRALFRG